MITNINTIGDVRSFFKQLLSEDLNFHPDTPFDDYINCETRLPTYTDEQVKQRDKLLDECFEICEKCRADIYEIAIEIFQPFS